MFHDLSYYHGIIDVQTTVKRLESEGVGSYLLRSNNDDEAILSYVAADKSVRHKLIPSRNDHHLLKNDPSLTDKRSIISFLVEDSIDLVKPAFRPGGVCNDHTYTSKRKEPHSDHTYDFGIIVCNICDCTVKADKEKSHRSLHYIIYCQECKKIFNSNINRRQHQAACGKQNSPDFNCKYCSYSSKSHQRLKIHEGLHNEEKLPARCQICNLAFPDDEELLHHQVKKHGDEYECRLCEKSFTSRKKAARHIKIHLEGRKKKPKKEHICWICDYVAKGPLRLTKHLLKHYRHRRPKPKLRKELKIRKCRSCSFTTTKRSTLSVHMKKNCPMRPIIIEPGQITFEKMWGLISNMMMSNRKAGKIFQSIKKIIGRRQFEKGSIKRMISECKA